MVTFKMYEKMNEIDRKNRLDKPTEVRVEVVLSFEFDMSDGVVLKLPENCYKCPCGFSSDIPGSCGRNVPFTDIDREGRPPTCKLVSFEEFLKNSNILSKIGLIKEELDVQGN